MSLENWVPEGTRYPVESAPRLAERTVAGLHESLLPRLEGIRRDGRVLDIGCGTGAWMDRLGREGFSSLHGIDLDTAQFASRWGSCSPANLDTDEIGLEASTCALITAIELIEHLENPGRLFVHVARLLEPGGAFVMTTPNMESVLCRLRFFLTGNLKQFDHLGDPTHIFPVLTVCLERILVRYGLKIDERWGYPEDGHSLSSRWSTRILSRILAPLVPRSIEGDIVCFRIIRADASR